MKSAIVLTLALAIPARAATFSVNSTQDRVDAVQADGVCDADLATPGEQCTLRAAVQQANASSDADTIVVPAGTYRLTIRGDEDASAAGDLDITTDVTILGAGPALTVIDGRRAKDRVVEIRGNAIIRGVTVQKGRAPQGSTGGGGLRNHGTLELTDAVVTRCRGADDAGGIDVRGGHVILRDVIVNRNRSGDDGGGIDVDGGIAELTRVTIDRNKAHDEGAGSRTRVPSMLTDCIVTANRARTDGGGLVNEDGGTMVLTGCLIAGNHAKTGAGSTRPTRARSEHDHGRLDTITKNRRATVLGRSAPRRQRRRRRSCKFWRFCASLSDALRDDVPLHPPSKPAIVMARSPSHCFAQRPSDGAWRVVHQRRPRPEHSSRSRRTLRAGSSRASSPRRGAGSCDRGASP
jgi:hypothetical protein